MRCDASRYDARRCEAVVGGSRVRVLYGCLARLSVQLFLHLKEHLIQRLRRLSDLALGTRHTITEHRKQVGKVRAFDETLLQQRVVAHKECRELGVIELALLHQALMKLCESLQQEIKKSRNQLVCHVKSISKCAALRRVASRLVRVIVCGRAGACARTLWLPVYT